MIKNRYLWTGLLLLLSIAIGSYFLFDDLIMPSVTRHDLSVEVPDLNNLSFDKANVHLKERNLEAVKQTGRFNPKLPKDVIVDQNPKAGAKVKPGRTIYLTINTGSAPEVVVPRVENISIREAINQILTVGLVATPPQPDSLPSPYDKTITRQMPAAGTKLAPGDTVRLWYSTGLGKCCVAIPKVTGMSVDRAMKRLLRLKLRSVIVKGNQILTREEIGEVLQNRVQRQSRQPETSVREGFEIRLFI